VTMLGEAAPMDARTTFDTTEDREEDMPVVWNCLLAVPITRVSRSGNRFGVAQATRG
jgi:hypothetical protein